MPASSGGPSSPEAGLPRLFLLIVLTEVAVIAVLYWFGAHFA
jgi:hypothetical protein